MAAQQEERGLHPQRAPAVGKQDFHLRKIYGNIVNVNGITVAVASPVKNRSPGVEHNRNSVGLGGSVDHFQFGNSILIVVGKQKLVRRVNLNHADLEPQKLLDVGQNVLAVTGMQAAARDQTPGVFLDVICDPLIDSGCKANDLGRNVVDEHAAIDSDGVHVFEERLGRPAELGDLLVIGPLAADQLQSVGMEHFHRRNVNVAVSDQVRGQPLHVEENGFLLALQMNIKEPMSRSRRISSRYQSLAPRRRRQRDYWVFRVSGIAFEINSRIKLLEQTASENS